MACESCLAARYAEMEERRRAVKAAQDRANNINRPVYVIQTPDGHTISDSMEPNTVEVMLPNH